MQPTIGRIVHLHLASEHDPVAAIITGVQPEGTVHLCIFPPLQLPGYPVSAVPYSDEPKPGHWTWPPREGVISAPTLTALDATDQIVARPTWGNLRGHR